MWDLLYQISASDSINATTNLGLAAIGFNGQEYWIAEWNTNVFHRLNINGQKVQSFTIPDQNGNAIVGTRGISWDGSYFYLCNNSNTIYQVDTLSRQTKSVINAPDIARAISFDPDADNGQGGFWISNWGSPGSEDGPLTQIDLQGNALRQIPASVHKLSSNYGLAYDGQSPGGPYLWAADQSGSGATIIQLDLSDGRQKASRKDMNAVLGTSGASGGLFIGENHPLFPNKRILGGLIQADPDLIYGMELDFELLQIDAVLTDMRPVSHYSVVPLKHIEAITLPIKVTNQGVMPIDSLHIHLEIQREGIPVFEDSYVAAGPNAFDSVLVSLAPWQASEQGNYTFIADVLPYPQQDQDTNNNQLQFDLLVSDTVYARDHNEVSGSLGIGAGPGQGSILGQTFELAETDFMTSISFYLDDPPVGDQVYASVYNVDSAQVPDVALSNTISYTISEQDAAEGVWLTLPFINGPLGMPAGKYFVGVNETNGNIGLGISDEGFSPKNSWVYWNSSPAGGWANNEAFGFNTAYMIRPNLGPCAPIYLKGEIQQNGLSLTAVPQGGKAPYTYQWNDSLTQTTATAFSLRPGTAYRVSVTDDNACVATLYSDTLQSSSNRIEVSSISDRWEVYPNPSSDVIWWEVKWKSPTKGIWQLSTIEGKILQTQAFASSVQNQTKIDLRELPAGIYVLEVMVGEYRFTERILRR